MFTNEIQAKYCLILIGENNNNFNFHYDVDTKQLFKNLNTYSS